MEPEETDFNERAFLSLVSAPSHRLESFRFYGDRFSYIVCLPNWPYQSVFHQPVTSPYSWDLALLVNLHRPIDMRTIIGPVQYLSAEELSLILFMVLRFLARTVSSEAERLITTYYDTWAFTEWFRQIIASSSTI